MKTLTLTDEQYALLVQLRDYAVKTGNVVDFVEGQYDEEADTDEADAASEQLWADIVALDEAVAAAK